MRSAASFLFVGLFVGLVVALGIGRCNREVERRDRARLAVEEEKRELQRKLRESDARVSALPGDDFVTKLESEQKRRELQRQLAEAEASAEASAKASGKPRPKPAVPEPCYTPGDPLCEEPSARPAGSAAPAPSR